MSPRPKPRSRDSSEPASSSNRNPADDLLDESIRMTRKLVKLVGPSITKMTTADLDSEEADKLIKRVRGLNRDAKTLSAQDLARRKFGKDNAEKLTRQQQIELCFSVFAEMSGLEQRDMLAKLQELMTNV